MKHTVAVDAPLPPVKPPFRPITLAMTFETLDEATRFRDAIGKMSAEEDGISFAAYAAFVRAVDAQRNAN